jgi:hypothetical protein
MNLTSSVENDAPVDATMFSLWAERRYNEPSSGGYWFWTLGAGINSVDVGDITATKGTYHIQTDS